jgi:hypothetical protein
MNVKGATVNANKPGGMASPFNDPIAPAHTCAGPNWEARPRSGSVLSHCRIDEETGPKCDIRVSCANQNGIHGFFQGHFALSPLLARETSYLRQRPSST